jgi:hypothetical protein
VGIAQQGLALQGGHQTLRQGAAGEGDHGDYPKLSLQG